MTNTPACGSQPRPHTVTVSAEIITICILSAQTERPIEFAYSTDWQSNVDKWASVLTKSYVVYLPEDYDGLIFAAETQPDNYKDSAKRMQLDSISPEACLMDIVTLDARSSLYFDIC